MSNPGKRGIDGMRGLFDGEAPLSVPAVAINGPLVLLERITDLGYLVTVDRIGAGLVRLQAYTALGIPGTNRPMKYVTAVQAETLQDAVFILGYELYQLREHRDPGHVAMIEDVLEAAAHAEADT